MNLKKFIGRLTAGVALVVGAFAFATVKEDSRQVKAEQGSGTQTTVYCAINSTTLGAQTLKAWVKYGTGGSDPNDLFTMTDTGETYNSNKVFSVSFRDHWNGIGYIYFQLFNGEEWAAEDKVIDNVWTTPTTYNGKIWVYGSTGGNRVWNSYEPEVEHTYAVAGILCGADRWGTNNIDMDVDSENHIATLSNLTLQKDDSFKIRADGGWSITYGWSDANGHITISNIGDFDDGDSCLAAAASDNNIDVIHDGTFNLSLNYSTGVLTITGTRANTDTVTVHTYNLHGDQNEWDPAGYGTYNSVNSTVEAHIDAGENFKIVADNLHYFGISALAAPGNHFEEGENNGNIKALVSGTYTFTLPDGFFSSGTGVTFTIDPDVADGAYLRGDWGTEGEDDWGWSEGGQMVMTGTGPYTVSNVPLGAGGAIKMVIYNNGIVTVWAQPSESTAGTAQFPAAREGEGGNVIVEKIGVYSVTITLVENTTYTYTLVGAEDPDLTAASTFATGFVSDMNDNCPYNNAQGKYNAGKSATTVANTWSAKMEAYADLSANAKLYLSTSKGSSVPAISAFWSSYDYIYVHYAEVRAIENADFLSRNPSASNVLSPITTLNNNVMLVILGVSVLVISATGLFFFAKKKKAR